MLNPDNPKKGRIFLSKFPKIIKKVGFSREKSQNHQKSRIFKGKIPKNWQKSTIVTQKSIKVQKFILIIYHFSSNVHLFPLKNMTLILFFRSKIFIFIFQNPLTPIILHTLTIPNGLKLSNIGLWNFQIVNLDPFGKHLQLST